MFVYGKTAANAIAIMSYLADSPTRKAGSAEIAEARGLSKALTAKLLTQLAAAGLVTGQPGPGGGYTLAKPADEICLLDIVRLFEQTQTASACPFGTHWCGTGPRCPMHDKIADMMSSVDCFMRETRLSIFLQSHPNPAVS